MFFNSITMALAMTFLAFTNNVFAESASPAADTDEPHLAYTYNGI